MFKVYHIASFNTLHLYSWLEFNVKHEKPDMQGKEVAKQFKEVGLTTNHVHQKSPPRPAALVQSPAFPLGKRPRQRTLMAAPVAKKPTSNAIHDTLLYMICS